MSSAVPPSTPTRPQVPSMGWPIASGAMFFGAVLLAVLVGPRTGSAFFGIGLLGGVVSIMLWAIYCYRRWATSTKAKAVFWVIHGSVLFAATIPANLMFDVVIGLPMSDFHFAGRIAYLMGVILSYLILILAAMGCGLVIIIFAAGPMFPWAKSTSRVFALGGLGLGFFGAIVICVAFLILMAQGSEQLLLGSAYLADCGRLKRYPGIEHDGRSRLHENGVVSTIRIRDGRFILDVSAFGDNKSR